MLKHCPEVRFGLKLLVSLFFLFASVTLFAQSDTSLSQSSQKDTTKAVFRDSTEDKRDIVDVLVKLFRPKHFRRSHLEPKIVSFLIVPGVYYSKATGLAGTVGASIVYLASAYTDQNLSTIFATALYAQKQQKTLSAYSNIWTNKNNYSFQGMAWYYQYSETTYGLGSNSANNKANTLDYKFVRFYETVFRQVAKDVHLGIGFKMDNHYHITEHGNMDGSISDFNYYGYKDHSFSAGPNFEFLYDTRRNALNPRRGTFINLAYSPKLTSFGSDQNWQSLKIDIRKFFRVTPAANNVLAFWALSQLTNGPAPYLDLPATEWDDLQRTGRGYIQGRFRGRDMLYFEGEFRFRITHKDVLGAVIFANTESFSDLNSSGFKRFLPAVGTGLRIKLNKYTRTNLCLDYGIGVNGSSAFFLNIAEMF